MNVRAQIRRAFPYLFVAVTGFALAYVLVLVFVLPSKIISDGQTPYVPDSLNKFEPIDPDGNAASTNTLDAPQVAPAPVGVPNVVGMSLPDARGILNAVRVNTIVRYDTSSVEAPDVVLRQIPEFGAKVSEHGMVTVIVSRPVTAADTTSSARDSILPAIQPADSDTTSH